MFKKILVLFITISFACSALEIEIGEAKQTFFDEYDTYIPSRPIMAEKDQVSDSKVKNLKLLKRFKACYVCYSFFHKAHSKYSDLLFKDNQRLPPPFLFATRKSVLRI